MITIFSDGATEGANGKLGTVKYCGIGFYCPDVNHKFSKRIEAGSNNEAEFWALIEAMNWARKQGFKEVRFCLDSQIVVNRARGRRPTGKFANERMNRFQDVVVRLTAEFKRAEFKWIPRHLNYMADIQSKASLYPTYA